MPITNTAKLATCASWLEPSAICFGYRVEEIRDTDIGTRAGLFEVLKIGDEFYSFLVDCKDPKACTILLRGASKDVLNEVDLFHHVVFSTAREREGVRVRGRAWA